MPNRTIYIRNEDLEKWNSIADKPEWLHSVLNGVTISEKTKFTGFDESPQGETRIDVNPKSHTYTTPNETPLGRRSNEWLYCLTLGCSCFRSFCRDWARRRLNAHWTNHSWNTCYRSYIHALGIEKTAMNIFAWFFVIWLFFKFVG